MRSDDGPGSESYERRVRNRLWVIESAQRELEFARKEYDENRRKELLAMPAIPLDLEHAAKANEISIGTSLVTGKTRGIALKNIRHMLVAGTSGSGKSVFLHSLLYQLMRQDGVKQIYVVDFKGGVEFAHYADTPGKVRTVWEYSDVESIVLELIDLMAQRQVIMRNSRLRDWPDERIFLVFDEFAEIHNMGADKRRHEKLMANIDSLARRARSAGIVLVIALQFPSNEALGATLRANLIQRVCFLLPSAMLAANVLPDYRDLDWNPRTLCVGEFIWQNLSNGKVRYFKAQVPPGLELTPVD